MLAQAATVENAVRTAETTWHELIDIAAASASGARTLKRSDLPEAIRSGYSAIESSTAKLQTLREHSEVTLQGIRSTIHGAVALPRNRLRAQVNETLAETQVVVLTGSPGSGKSALAKAVVQWQADNYVCLSFRAEEFAESHIDRVLQRQLSGRQLETILAAQERVLLHVESLERLLEHPTRDAFTDLIRVAERAQNVRLLITCRDYSVTTALDSFFGQSGLYCETIEVPLLDDSELNEIEESLPQLVTPLSSPKLRQLLRIPYFIDMAARMDWTSGQDMPSDVRAFRQRCWSEVVRRDSLTTAGLPDKRERTLVDLAVRRARELRPAVSVDGIDSESIDALYKDGIIAKFSHGLAAPSHDVIEDWAIVHWLDSLAAKHEWQAHPIADSVGERPALRRGFREWLKEALERETVKADQFVLSAYGDSSLSQHFRDDVLTSVLLSHSARGFVSRQRDQLAANDANLLVRLIHLTRVACKTVPRWLGDQNTIPSALMEPVGEAWPAVLEAVADGIDGLLPAHAGVVVGLLEDWSRGANWEASLPEGVMPAGKIVYRLLEGLEDHRQDDLRKRVLKVIATVPRADEKAFIALVQRALDRVGRSDPLPQDFAEILLYGLDGMSACRDFPEQIAQLVMSWCCMTDADLERMRHPYSSSLDIEYEFGLAGYIGHTYFPSSAIRRPFLAMLKSHPSIGVQLVLDLVNHAGSWYGEQKWPTFRLEPAQLITISVPSHGEVEQWANARLWESHRGTSVTPHVIQCALMALESWLLELCEGTEEIEQWLLKILLESNNVMTTAVVASVCNAHPRRGGEAALALLTSGEAVRMDRSRMVKETSSDFLASLPSLDPTNSFYNDERKQANALGHRSHDLEALAWKLQLGGKAEQIWQIIDAHRSTIPGEAERTDEDKTWLLALHRMDARNYATESKAPRSESEDLKNETEQDVTISLKSKGLADDLQEFVDAGADQMQQFVSSAKLLNWGIQQWERRPDRGDTDSWRTALTQAKEIQRDSVSSGPNWLADGGYGIVAAICVRDHWEDMDPVDRQWCLDTLVAEVNRDCDTEDYTKQIALNTMNADRHSAYVLPKLLSYNPDNTTVLNAVSKAVTHACDQVALWAAEGAGEYLVSQDDDLMQRCAGAVAMQSNLLETHWKQRSHGVNQWASIDNATVQRVRDQVRRAFVADAIDIEKEVTAFDFSSWSGQHLAARIMVILGKVPNLALSIAFFTRAAQAVVASWAAERQDWNSQRDFTFEYAVMMRLAGIALTLPPHAALVCCGPFLDAVEDHPQDVATFVEALISQEDQSSSDESSFWHIWALFAERVLDASWLPSINSKHSRGTDLVEKMLLQTYWNEGVRHWRRLDGHEQEVDDFVTRLPVGRAALLAYSYYLYKVGEGALPKAFVVVANRMEGGDPRELLSDGNTVFYLESLLRRYVYGQPLRLREDPTLRKAVLVILDQLVEAGSSAAYRMRDDFVTPSAHARGRV